MNFQPFLVLLRPCKAPVPGWDLQPRDVPGTRQGSEHQGWPFPPTAQCPQNPASPFICPCRRGASKLPRPTRTVLPDQGEAQNSASTTQPKFLSKWLRLHLGDKLQGSQLSQEEEGGYLPSLGYQESPQGTDKEPLPLAASQEEGAELAGCSAPRTGPQEASLQEASQRQAAQRDVPLRAGDRCSAGRASCASSTSESSTASAGSP